MIFILVCQKNTLLAVPKNKGMLAKSEIWVLFEQHDYTANRHIAINHFFEFVCGDALENH